MTPEQAHLQAHLRRLKRHRMEQVLDHVAEESIKTPWSDTEFLARVLDAEVEARYERTTLSRIRLARCPFTNTLADGDFSCQPSLDQQERRALATLRVIEAGENMLFRGLPGVGKTPWPRPAA